MPFCMAVTAPCGLPLPQIAVPCILSVALSIFMYNYVCRTAAVRHGYISPFGPYISAQGLHLSPLHSPCVCSWVARPNISLASTCACGAVRRSIFSMTSTSCINFSGCVARCVLRTLLRLHLLLPDLPLRPPAFSHLTPSLSSPSSSAASLPRPSVSLLLCFSIRTSVYCLSLGCRLPQPCCRALQLRPVLFVHSSGTTSHFLFSLFFILLLFYLLR
jgi:hypothetical protein